MNGKIQCVCEEKEWERKKRKTAVLRTDSGRRLDCRWIVLGPVLTLGVHAYISMMKPCTYTNGDWTNTFGLKLARASDVIQKWCRRVIQILACPFRWTYTDYDNDGCYIKYNRVEFRQERERWLLPIVPAECKSRTTAIGMLFDACVAPKRYFNETGEIVSMKSNDDDKKKRMYEWIRPWYSVA